MRLVIPTVEQNVGAGWLNGHGAFSLDVAAVIVRHRIIIIVRC